MGGDSHQFMRGSAKTKRIKIVFFTTKSSDERSRREQEVRWIAARPGGARLGLVGLVPPRTGPGARRHRRQHTPIHGLQHRWGDGETREEGRLSA